MPELPGTNRSWNEKYHDLAGLEEPKVNLRQEK
jgi:hypothetical protein